MNLVIRGEIETKNKKQIVSTAYHNDRSKNVEAGMVTYQINCSKALATLKINLAAQLDLIKSTSLQR